MLVAKSSIIRLYPYKHRGYKHSEGLVGESWYPRDRIDSYGLMGARMGGSNGEGKERGGEGKNTRETAKTKDHLSSWMKTQYSRCIYEGNINGIAKICQLLRWMVKV